MQFKVGVNGCGRLGRAFVRQYLEMSTPSFQIKVINDPMPLDQLIYLLQYDSVHGRLSVPVNLSADGQSLSTPHGEIHYSQTESIPDWTAYSLDILVELSGAHTRMSQVAKHLSSGVSTVLLGAPLLDENGQICRQLPSWAQGIWPGQSVVAPVQKGVFSAFSCTTQALVTLLQPLLMNKVSIESIMVTELHGFTSSQHLLDGPHKDWRRGRGATTSIIPTQTQGIYGTEQLFPELADRVSGYSIRVPVPDVAALDVSLHLTEQMELEEVLTLFKSASDGVLKHKLALEFQPLVSVDFIGRIESAVLAVDLCQVNRHQLRLYAWYDNEYGYARRLLDSLGS